VAHPNRYLTTDINLTSEHLSGTEQRKTIYIKQRNNIIGSVDVLMSHKGETVVEINAVPGSDIKVIVHTD